MQFHISNMASKNPGEIFPVEISVTIPDGMLMTDPLTGKMPEDTKQFVKTHVNSVTGFQCTQFALMVY